jgi:two-component system phosphate regulon response regulator PhoB
MVLMTDQILRVLVIDDDLELLKSVGFELGSTGWIIAVAATPHDGLEMARRLVPNVILCDARMPIMSGLEVVQILKRDSITAHIPIVLMMTGGDEPDIVGNVPVTTFLAKPFGSKQLIEAICTAASTPL